jgi:hypothetical protein
MAQALPTFFSDDIAQTAMEARVPTVVANTGVTYGGGNAPGIGISTENPNLEESLPSWTLLDQHGNARTAQISQCIGGDGITEAADWPGSGGTEGTLPDAVIRFGTNPDNVDGQPDNNEPITVGNGADLVLLATGWEDAL